MQAAAAPVKYAGRIYVIECAVVMGLYVAAVWIRPCWWITPPITLSRLPPKFYLHYQSG